ncbi:hypothetical protein L596_002296 [Steinernema carpocapsae]|nr:hypothetical protein L596_002296 [Steinernema carpocapsae]
MEVRLRADTSHKKEEEKAETIDGTTENSPEGEKEVQWAVAVPCAVVQEMGASAPVRQPKQARTRPL